MIGRRASAVLRKVFSLVTFESRRMGVDGLFGEASHA